jgi:hypothetical protein
MTTARDSSLRPADCRWSLDTGQQGRARDHHQAWTAALAATVQTWREGHPGPVTITVEDSRAWLAPALDEHRIVDLAASVAAAEQLLDELLAHAGTRAQVN